MTNEKLAVFLKWISPWSKKYCKLVELFVERST